MEKGLNELLELMLKESEIKIKVEKTETKASQE